ncbi:MAG: GWxTD domain-containing protein [candidate division Zixibacteria bacterium]|nr:GWxTD domain-containing protein [candidate division Zixibacteria bacterium]MDD5426250.1 GWxTD domain-containing protein [candidate division Zixibacteria bacterium]
MKYFSTSVLISLLLVFSPRAQFNFFDNSRAAVQPLIQIDHAGFKSPDSGKVRLEIYYQVFNFGFEYRSQGSDYIAEYDIMITVNDNNNAVVASDTKNRNIIVPDEEKTRSRTDFRTSQVNFDLPPGKYKVAVIVRDRYSEKSYSTGFDVKLRNHYEPTPQLSDIEFIRTVEALKEETGVFDKGNLVVIPSVGRSFGGDDNVKMRYYFEIYRGEDTTENVDIETKIRKKNGSMVYRDTLNNILKGPLEMQLREISLEDFAPGQYELEVYMRGRRNKKLDERKETFTVQWSLRGLLRHDFNTAIEQLAIIAQPGQVEKMKKIESEEERLKAFNEFWKALDNTPETPRNEFQVEFYRRINFANQHFKSFRHEGWRTDRGRILIKYGEPDEIDDVPMSLTSPPYQIWHYYKIGAYRKFTFLDLNEDGEYRLQFPYDGLDQSPDY